MRIILPLYLSLLTLTLQAQSMFYNGGEYTYIGDDATMIVTNGDYQNETGITENLGELTIEGSYINNDSTIGGALGSEFILTKDWENNHFFDADSSNVRLTGQNQLIKGTSISTFFDLTLENTGIKGLEIDANTSHVLTLNDLELATNDFNMTVLNPDIFAIDFIEDLGFVSSTNDGRLIRNTNSNGIYIFPVGQINNGLKYRPVEIMPTVADTQQFEVRLVYDSATNEGIPLTNLDLDIDYVNPHFFHFIRQTQGNDLAALSIFYDASIEGDWEEIARYENNLWTNLGNGFPLSNSYLEQITKIDWLSTSIEPHILATTKEETTLPEGPLYAIPNAFTPLGTQGENSTFGIINQNSAVNLQSMKIYNRWGQEVFNSETSGQENWDGYFLGELQPTGNYVYIINLIEASTGTPISPISGNILLIR